MFKFVINVVVIISLGYSQAKGNYTDSLCKKRVLHHCNTSTFRNGDTIHHAQNTDEWIQACQLGVPAWSYAYNDTIIGNDIKKLYNFHAIHDPRGILPLGYSIPTKEVARKMVKDDTSLMRLAIIPFKSGSGEEDSIHGGIRNSNGMFNFQKEVITWWTSSLIDEDEVVIGDIYGLVYSLKFNDFSVLEVDKCSGMYVIGVNEE